MTTPARLVGAVTALVLAVVLTGGGLVVVIVRNTLAGAAPAVLQAITFQLGTGLATTAAVAALAVMVVGKVCARHYQAFARQVELSEERYALALDGSEDGLWDWDIVNDRVMLSGRFDAFGFGPADRGMAAAVWMGRVHPDDRERVDAAFAAHFHRTVPYLHVDYRVIAPGGGISWVRHRGKALFGSDGKAYRMAGSVGDITELKRREHEVIDLNHSLEQRVAARTAEIEAAYRELNRTNELILESLRYASKIQDALLPDKRALGDAVTDIAVCWEPLQVVGGDYFWLEQAGSRSYIIVADCTGHGVPGAFMTLITASAIDHALHHGGDRSPAAILERLDDMVRARLRQDRPDSPSDDGLDACVCVWDRDSRTLTYAGANVPLLYTGAGDLHEIRGSRTSLGYRTTRQRGPLVEHTIPVEPGMTFYLYTDGVPDHMGARSRRLLGRTQLRQMLASRIDLPLADQLAGLQDDLAAYRGEEPRRDDMTLIIVRPL